MISVFDFGGSRTTGAFLTERLDIGKSGWTRAAKRIFMRRGSGKGTGIHIGRLREPSTPRS
jgi:hypothetical protein